MNRINILNAIDIMEDTLNTKKSKIDNYPNAISKSLEIKQLQAECIALDEAIEVLHNTVREDIAKEKEAIKLISSKVFL